MDWEIPIIAREKEEAQQYFTKENVNKIYTRLREETDIFMQHYPVLGVDAIYGIGNLCLSEKEKDGKRTYEFFIIDRATKFDYAEFDDIKNAINHLATFLEEIESKEDCEKMRNIIYETLKLEKNKVYTKK